MFYEKAIFYISDEIAKENIFLVFLTYEKKKQLLSFDNNMSMPYNCGSYIHMDPQTITYQSIYIF